ARKAVKELMISKKKSVKVTEKSLEEFLGVPKYRYGEIESEPQVGIVTGLAWTDVGGELLTIEGVMMPGKGKMTVTGNLRDAMKGGMDIIPVARLDDVIAKALVRAPVPIVWEEDTKVPVKPDASDDAGEGLTAH